MTKSLMCKPRSDELPPLPEPQESSEDESSESQMRKVMRKVIKNLDTEMKTRKYQVIEKKCLSYLCIIKKEWQDVLVNLFFTVF